LAFCPAVRFFGTFLAHTFSSLYPMLRCDGR
jgi:hypothetical protein